MVTADKLPPFDIEAEEACIASILVDEEAIGRVEGSSSRTTSIAIRTAGRTRPAWRCGSATSRINQVTLAHELSRREKLDDVGRHPVPRAHRRRAARRPSASSTTPHIVKRDATYRAMITAGSQIVQLAYQGGPDLDGAITPRREPRDGAAASRSG